MRSPNFFILGAPKCGTTSLAAWLAAHPRIYMAPVKEPHFFNTDDRQGVSTLAEYDALFSQANDHHSAVGEASVWYLSSSAAVGNILRYQPDARFIVLLRNPVEMVPALHAEMVLSGHENVRDFRAAWDLQDARRQGRHLPLFTWARRRLLYGEACALGAQMERLLAVAARERVLPVVLDDMATDPSAEYLRVLRFLGVADDGRKDFPVRNRARVPQHPILDADAVRREPDQKPGGSPPQSGDLGAVRQSQHYAGRPSSADGGDDRDAARLFPRGRHAPR